MTITDKPTESVPEKVPKITKDGVDIAKLMLKAEMLYKGIQVLYNKINYENNISRNHLCPCGSKKRWKRCCKYIHEEETLKLEAMIKEYKSMCVEINRRKKDEVRRTPNTDTASAIKELKNGGGTHYKNSQEMYDDLDI